MSQAPPVDDTKLVRALFRIAEHAAANLSFYDFLQAVHGILKDLLYARNCYVCLVHHERQVLDFPYYVDERDGDSMQATDVPMRRGLTEFVLRTGMPQRIDAARFRALQDSGEVTEATGDLGFSSWLGVPMGLHGRIGGVLVVQSYESGISYSERDAQVLSFVAHHFSAAVERHQVIEQLRKSEERYRMVVEHAGEGMLVLKNGRVVFINRRGSEIVRLPHEQAMRVGYLDKIHPDDRPMVAERGRRRLAGEAMPPSYEIRLVHDDGELRWLELNVTVVPWEGEDAILTFFSDITERKQAEQNVLAALAKQRELNELKSRFVAMTSHEFRTPLASILSSSQLLQHYGERLPASEKAELANTIDESVQRMTHMLDRILLLGKADADMLEFKPRELDVVPLCRELAEAVGPQHCSLRLDFGEPVLAGAFDEQLLRHILGNLLSNAVKYSPAGGTVTLAVARVEERMQFSVSDQGIGIPAADLPTLFQSFHRATNVGDIKGTGLGLAIVKSAVDLHRGEITVSSEVGRGTRMVVRI